MSVSITNTNDQTLQASAFFTSTDPTGAIVTSVDISASAEVDTTNGKTTATVSSVGLSISVANQVAGYFVIVAEAPASTQTIQIDPNLKTAHLVGTFTLVDQNGVSFNATANVVFKETDAVQTTVTPTLSSSGRGSATFEINGYSGDDAVATGVVRVGANVFHAAIANAIPNPSYQGSIGNVIDDTTTVTVSLPLKGCSLIQTIRAAATTLNDSDLLQQLTGM